MSFRSSEDFANVETIELMYWVGSMSAMVDSDMVPVSQTKVPPLDGSLLRDQHLLA